MYGHKPVCPYVPIFKTTASPAFGELVIDTPEGFVEQRSIALPYQIGVVPCFVAKYL